MTIHSFQSDYCWAYAAIECIEALYKIETSEEIQLSPQHIIDMVARSHITGYFESGMASVLDSFRLAKTEGIALEEDWPLNDGFWPNLPFWPFKKRQINVSIQPFAYYYLNCS